jgi:hypothetical protein
MPGLILPPSFQMVCQGRASGRVTQFHKITGSQLAVEACDSVEKRICVRVEIIRDDTLFAFRRIELCRTFCDGRPVMVSEFTVEV